MGPDWNLIRSFAAVAEAGSLSGAARRIGVSQPTLGRHIAELEQALGLVLFRRGHGGYEPTQQGLALLARAQAMREQAEAFSRLAFGTAETVSGTVRIAASEVVAACVLPAMLARFAQAEPGIEIEIVASDLVENLLRRDADIAIRMVEPRQLDLVARKVTDIPLTACASRAYLDRRGRPVALQDLLGHDLIGFDRSNDMIEAFRRLGVTVDRHAFRLRSDNQLVLWNAVRAGNGIGFGHKPLVMADTELDALLPDLPLPSLPVWLAMHRDVRTSARMRRVADFLFEDLKAYAAPLA